MTTPRVLAPYILRALATAQAAGRPMNLQLLTDRLDVRRTDVRAALSAMHAQGLVDVTTMRLSLEGFTIGLSLRKAKLPPLRSVVTEQAPACAPSSRTAAA